MTMPMKTPVVLTLDDLSRLRSRELEAVYAEGLLPERLSALNGRPRGRVLAIAHLDRGPLLKMVSLVVGSRFFPWEGKNFASTGKKTGGGRNRVNLLARDFEWFGFKTRVEKSLLDGKPCVRLDYGMAENPWPVNKVKDELREVSPGLYLGPSLLQLRQEPRLLYWFAVDARVQC
jgi:hypothetical protein